jgi:riboflavin synthase
LIEEIGTIKNIKHEGRSASITIEAKKILDDIRIGDSISTNGVCLTVTKFSQNQFTVDVMPETMNRSNLKDLKTKDLVNLERAMQINQRFGGHIVSGHIDGTGIIADLKEDENATWVTIKTGKEILKYIIEKGSITIDGISLTVASVSEQDFKVSLIPLTKNDTTLITKKINESVNLECDMVGKYVEKLLKFTDNEENKKSNLTMEFLRNHGF